MLKQTIIVLTGAAAFGVGFTGFSSAQAAGLTRGNAFSIDFDKTADGTILTGGTVLTGNEWSSWGVTLDVDARKQSLDQLWIFDSSCETSSCDRDDDLRTGSGLMNTSVYKSMDEGNVAIIQEFGGGGSTTTPDDSAKGGTFSFDFSSSIDEKIAGILPESIRLIDIDKNPGEGRVEFVITTADGNKLDPVKAKKFDDADRNVMFRGYTGEDNGVLVDEGDFGDNSVVVYDLSNIDGLRVSEVNLVGVKSVDVVFKGSGAIADFAWSQLTRTHVDEPASIPEPASVLGLASLAALASVQAGRKRSQQA
jgi:hypothetical protein